MSVTLFRTSLAFAALAVLLTAGPARAQQAALKPACNIKALPLIQGTEWTFEAVAPPNQPQSQGPLPKPKQPAVVKLKVVSVTTLPPATRGQPPVTEIMLEESADSRTYTSKLTCDKDRLFVPPQSFLFSGEPGGGLQLTLGELQRDPESAASYMFKLGLLRVPEWIENVKTTFTRTPTEGTGAKLVDGALDLQRIIIIGLPEAVTTRLGTFTTTPVQVDLRGSVLLKVGPEPKEFEMPAGTLSKLWFADNVGLVQVYNTNWHMYQLVDVKTPDGKPLPVKPAAPAAPGTTPAPGTPAAPGAKPAPAAQPAPAPAAPAPAAPAAPPAQ